MMEMMMKLKVMIDLCSYVYCHTHVRIVIIYQTVPLYEEEFIKDQVWQC